MSPARNAIVDLHCDLLSYLDDGPERGPEDPASRCSLSQLEAGGVALQVTAAFVPTAPGSSASAERQMAWFDRLRRRVAEERRSVRVVAAIENAAGLAAEDEPFAAAVERLRRWHRESGGLMSVSLTHHYENRFGGGNFSGGGLKPDGRRLLPELAGLGIALDLAHTSDALAEDCLAFIDRERLPLAVLCTHTAFRAVRDTPRNISDPVALEVIRRGGLIGLAALRSFLGPDDPANLARQVGHGLALGGERALAFGADFYCTEDMTPEAREEPAHKKYLNCVPEFFPFWQDASGFPAALRKLEEDGGFAPSFLAALARGNAENWLAGRGTGADSGSARPAVPTATAAPSPPRAGP